MTNLRSGAASRRAADDENFEYPEYTPNFIKLAESYGAVGIRVEKKEDIEPAFRAALENKHRPTIIEFMIRSGGSCIPNDQTGRNSGRADHGL